MIKIEFKYPSINKTILNVLNDYMHLGLGLLILYSFIKGSSSGVNNTMLGSAKKIKQFGVETQVSVKFKDIAGQ